MVYIIAAGTDSILIRLLALIIYYFLIYVLSGHCYASGLYVLFLLSSPNQIPIMLKWQLSIESWNLYLKYDTAPKSWQNLSMMFVLSFK